jgi:hypothetical protein
MTKVIDVMKSQGVKRIIFTSALGVADSEKHIPSWFKWLIKNCNIRYPYLDHERQEALAAASGLDWTAVRPAALTNRKRPGNIVVSIDNVPRPSLSISRRDTAAFILKILEENSYIKSLPVISDKD